MKRIVLCAAAAAIMFSAHEAPAQPAFCARILQSGPVQAFRNLIQTKSLSPDAAALASQAVSEARSFRVDVRSAVSSLFFTYLSWKLTGVPVPAYLPAATFPNVALHQGYARLRAVYHWALVGGSAVFLASHPQIISYFTDAFLLSGNDLAIHQEQTFDLESARKMLWESWKQAFYDFEGRWPDPTQHPEDLAEWTREQLRINSLTPEQIKFDFSKRG